MAEHCDFNGFSSAALDFYDDLELDNTKSFWTEHKHIYDTEVRAPMVALTSALESEFGPAKLFRPYRDVRFAKDKTPYKTHQGAFVATAEATGWYIELGPAGVRIAAGFYHASPSALERFRRAVADDVRGPELERLLARLRRAGWVVGGDRLKTSPRGFSADHERIELLRHRSLTVGKDYGFGAVIQSADLLAQVVKDWRKARPLVDWATSHVGGAARIRA